MEVIPRSPDIEAITFRILHVCGGDPLVYVSGMLQGQVFSTYVEVILQCHNPAVLDKSILHVCGGDPTAIRVAKILLSYSPRMWR